MSNIKTAPILSFKVLSNVLSETRYRTDASKLVWAVDYVDDTGLRKVWSTRTHERLVTYLLCQRNRLLYSMTSLREAMVSRQYLDKLGWNPRLIHFPADQDRPLVGILMPNRVFTE